MYPFNVRVYGLLINDNQEILVSDEHEYGMNFTKFPGGGLEYGEGITDGLKREFIEECNTDVAVVSHFYTTDFFVKSAFNDSQIISIYYRVKALTKLDVAIKNIPFDFDGEGTVPQAFRWIKLADLQPEDFTFSIDQHVAKLLINNI
jgi:8-oxo-dGTP diphosphatase